MQRLGLLFVLLLSVSNARAEGSSTDSAGAAHALSVLRNHAKADPAAGFVSMADAGAACRYVMYRSPAQSSEKKPWRTFCDSSKPEHLVYASNICLRVSSIFASATGFTIDRYESAVESEGEWHVLHATVQRKDNKERLVFAFLKVDGRFGLGDIDEEFLDE